MLLEYEKAAAKTAAQSIDKLRFVNAEEESLRLPEILTDFRAAA